MPYGNIVNQFIPYLSSDQTRSGEHNTPRSVPAGLLQLAVVFIAIWLMLMVFVALVFHGSETGIHKGEVFQSLERPDPLCFGVFDLSEIHKHETLRRRVPLGDDLPEFVIKDYCHVPVL